MLNIISRFNEHINSFHLIDSNKIAVALSGGADSLALTLLTLQWIKKFKNRELVALTVNHNLRKEAPAEAKLVTQMLSEHGIEHHILNWEHKETITANIQHKARIARRELLTKWCVEHDVLNLLVAHTKNDIVETFFMNIFRGSGIYGLSSIPKETLVRGIRIIRPVSIFTKDELKYYLRKNRIDWIEDPSNQNERFLRVKVRKLFESKEMKAIMPDADLFLQRIVTNVQNISRARNCIESITAEETAKIVTSCHKGLLIDQQKFCAIHPEIALNLLASSLIAVSEEHEYKPRLNSLELLYNFIRSNSSGAKTLWKCKIKIEKDAVKIQKENGKDKLLCFKKET